MLDIERMRQIAENLYVAHAHKAFGEQGSQTLRFLIDTVVQIYRRLDPASRNQPLIVFRNLGDRDADQLDAPVVSRLSHPALINSELDGPCAVEVAGNGSLLVRSLDQVDPKGASKSAVVYLFRDGSETIFIDGVAFNLINPCNSHASIFARPTFSSLRSALESYKARVALNTSCQILSGVWIGPGRLFFRAKPESTMRKSLLQFLENVLQDAEVRPEQNVDESHPVDIKVTWLLSDQRAIIEIKWLGDSLAELGVEATSYRDSRARSGAKQLAEYLDESLKWGPKVRTRGYLTVFDGRRRGLSSDQTNIDSEDGMFYRSRDIDYDPDYSAIRTDFDPPIRFFMNPSGAQ